MSHATGTGASGRGTIDAERGAAAEFGTHRHRDRRRARDYARAAAFFTSAHQLRRFSTT
jgi:hypothetical protein